MRLRVREDKDEVARCPFCNSVLMAPARMKTETGECTGGRCGCGAVYVYDPTGHNLGEAYLDAMTLVGGDWNELSEGSYAEAVFNYDPRKHTLAPIKDIRRVDTTGKVIFLKVREPDR